MTTVTIICSDDHEPTMPLIYAVELPDHVMVEGSEGKDILDPSMDIHDRIHAAVVQQRSDDLDSPVDPNSISLHFAFRGDLYPVFDWR